MLGQVRLERAPYRLQAQKGITRYVFQHMSKQLIVLHLSSLWQHKPECTNHTVFTPGLFCVESGGGAVIFQVCPEAQGRGLAASCRAKRHMGAMPLHHLADDSLDVLTCLGQLCADCTDGAPHAGWPWPRDLKGEKHANPSCAELCVPHRLLSNLPLPPREYVGHC